MRTFKNQTTITNNSSVRNLRNIGISAHIDSGKTTLTERMLFYGGRIHKMREVRGGDGGATMDFDPIEKRRGITIASAVTRVDWGQQAINIIDTPGHVDFTVEVERSLRVLDGAVLVLCASRGVQSQSLTVDRQMKRYRVPRIAFVNKMDRIGADPQSVIEGMQQRLSDHPIAIQLPMGREESFVGVIDLITMRAIYYDGQHGEIVRFETIPYDYMAAATKARSQMLEALAMLDDELMQPLISGQIPTAEEIRAAIGRQTLMRKMTPVLFGTAMKNKGVQQLLDAVNLYLPSPAERKIDAYDQTNEKVELQCDSSLPTIAMVFKTVVEKFGQLTFVRVYQGTLQQGDSLVNVRTGKKVRLGRLVRIHAGQRQDIGMAEAGDIVGVLGIDCVSGDTFAQPGTEVLLESFVVAKPVVQLSIAPKNRDDVDKLATALVCLAKNDPTFQVSTQSDCGETLIAGMGRLHLQVCVEKIETDFGCPCVVGTPSVAYQARPSRSVEFEHQFKKMTGGPGQFARIAGRLEPLAGEEVYTFAETITGGRIDQRFIPAVDRGFQESLQGGPLGGFPVTGVAMTLVDGKQHENDSSEMSFRNCAAQAMRDSVLPRAGLRLWEPVMEVEIELPEAYLGPVSGHLTRRRGVLKKSTVTAAGGAIVAMAPLAELFDYSNELRSLTQGAGTFSMTPAGYQVVPADVQEKVLLGQSSD